MQYAEVASIAIGTVPDGLTFLFRSTIRNSFTLIETSATIMDFVTLFDTETDVTRREQPSHIRSNKPIKHHEMRKQKSLGLYNNGSAVTPKGKTSRHGEEKRGTPQPPVTKITIARVATDSTTGEEEDMLLDELTLLLMEGVNKRSSKDVTDALERLADLCSQCDAMCREACHMGAPATVVSVMRKWSSSKAVQGEGFRVLIALTVGSTCGKIQKTLWMAGSMEAIIDAMTKFPESRSIQFFGCSAILGLLPCGDDQKKLSKWMGRRFIEEIKGVKAVISAMIQFEEDWHLQETGCGVLLKLATFMHDGEDRKMLLESGAVSAFSVALESHPNDDVIQDYTTMFMNFLSSSDD